LEKPLEIIVVDDDSCDKTRGIAEEEGVLVIHNQENLGFTKSVKRGVEASKGEILVKIDADGEIPEKYVEEAVKKLKVFDVVIGKKERFHRSSEKIVSFLSSFFTGLPYGADMFPGLIVFKRSVYEGIGFDEWNSWLLGFLYKAVKKGYKVGLIPITFNQRLDSKIGYSWKTDLKLLRAGLRAFIHGFVLQK